MLLLAADARTVLLLDRPAASASRPEQGTDFGGSAGCRFRVKSADGAHFLACAPRALTTSSTSSTLTGVVVMTASPPQSNASSDVSRSPTPAPILTGAAPEVVLIRLGKAGFLINRPYVPPGSLAISVRI